MFPSDINMEQTSLQRTKQISKRVKKAKLLNTVSVTFKWHEGTQNTAARLIWTLESLEKSSQSEDHLWTLNRPHVSKVWLYFWAVRKATSQPYGNKSHLCKKANKEDLGANMFSWWGTVPRSLNPPSKSKWPWWRRRKTNKITTACDQNDSPKILLLVIFISLTY